MFLCSLECVGVIENQGAIKKQHVLIFKVEQLGPGACHTGHRSCFYRKVTPDGLTEVETTVFDADKVYTKQA